MPESWVWTTISTFTHNLTYGTSEKSNSTGLIPVLRMGNINRKGGLDWDDLVFTSNKYDIIKYNLEYNDLLFNRTNSSDWVGKTAIYKGERKAIFAGYLIRLRTICINADYLNLVMNSSYHRDWCDEVKTDAVNQSNINAQKLSCYSVPIPPLAEQKRIVDMVASWLVLIDQIEQDQASLTTIIKQAKNKILTLAIHGKLVPQDPNDESAIEILKRVNPNFTPCDNAHYPQLPSGWAYSRLGDICKLKNGYAFKSGLYSTQGVRIIRIANVQDGYIEDDAPQYYDFDKMKGLDSFLLSDGDLLMSLTGNVGRVCFITKKFLPAALNQRVACVRNNEVPINKEYLFHLFQSEKFVKDCKDSGKGVAQQNISTEWLKEYIVPLPPLLEQDRIVTLIKGIYSYLDIIMDGL